jgi:hypothetical protein
MEPATVAVASRTTMLLFKLLNSSCSQSHYAIAFQIAIQHSVNRQCCSIQLIAGGGTHRMHHHVLGALTSAWQGRTAITAAAGSVLLAPSRWWNSATTVTRHLNR